MAVIEWDKYLLRGVILAALAGGAWYYFRGPGAQDAGNTTSTGGEDPELFRQHTRAVNVGDSIAVVREKMRRPEDRIAKKTDPFEEHLWTSPDGHVFTVTIDIGSQQVTDKLLR